MPVRVDDSYDGLDVPVFDNPREITAVLHEHLRRLIIDEVIPPGGTLNQADLARRFNVSRIPLREAFRMLQQEGLIDVQVNQRATVRALDAHEVDQLYGARIALESLAVTITAGRLQKAELASAHRCLVGMQRALRVQDMRTWIAVHRTFHILVTARASDPLARIMSSFAERTERYLRFAQLVHPERFTQAEYEHEHILAAVADGDTDRARELMARHLADTARIVLTGLDADAAGDAIREALRMALHGG